METKATHTRLFVFHDTIQKRDDLPDGRNSRANQAGRNRTHAVKRVWWVEYRCIVAIKLTLSIPDSA
jgi:hypothetical protein